MTAVHEPIVLKPVASVRHTVADDEVSRQRRELVSVVSVLPEYADGLLGIEAYSHLVILFWMHRAEPPTSLHCHPRGDESLPEFGVFAARGRNHPNPLGLAVVELLGVRGNELTVQRLDAFDGTPVIDIKPYDDYDVVADPRVPDWFRLRARGDRGPGR